MKSYTLNNGVTIPVLGFGTWKAENGEIAYQAVLEALKAGYRHIDLAQALQTQLVQAGISPERICDLGLCTVCHTDEFFSYRAENGVTGRHGAFAVRST